jgi:questin oxidase-like protein
MSAPVTDHRSDMMLVALDRLRGTGAEFGGFLSNHGPMAADAMIRLGGGDRVERWVEHYRVQLAPAPKPGDSVTSENWRVNLGRIDRLGDWDSYFRGQLGHEHWQGVLAAWWPRLLPGAAAGATHGLIRTAHAVRNLVEGADPDPLLVDELGAGLAYWAARHQPLPGNPTLSGRWMLAEAVARLPRLDRSVASDGPGLMGRLQSLFRLDGLPEAVDGWGPATGDEEALDELISFSARVLLTRRGAQIAYCHAVTAPAAIRMILPALPAEQHRATVAAAWHLAAAIIAAFASPRPDDLASADEPAGNPVEIAEAAIEHGDDHVIKLTEACIRQFRLTGDLTLLVAAERFRSRIDPGW